MHVPCVHRLTGWVFWCTLWHVHPEIPCQSKRDGVKHTYVPSTLWRIFYETFLLQWQNMHVSIKDEMLPSPHVLKMGFQVYACLVPGLVFWIFWSHPEGRSKINIAIALRLVTELGDSMWPYLLILLLTLCFLYFFLLFVCLSLSLSPVAAILLHGCPDCGLRCGGRLLLWDTTWRQVAVLFPFSQVPKSSPA